MKFTDKNRARSTNASTVACLRDTAFARLNYVALVAGVLLFSAQLCAVNVGLLDSTADSDFPKFNGAVNTMIEGDKVLYVGGSFSRQLRAGAGNLIYADSANGDVSFNNLPKLAGTVYALISDGSDGWIVGGTNLTVGGVALPNLLHINNSGNISDWTAFAPNSSVSALALDSMQGIVYVGGQFDKMGTEARAGLAAINISNGTLSNWTATLTGVTLANVTALTLDNVNNRLFVVAKPTGVLDGPNLYAFNATTGVAIAAWAPAIGTYSGPNKGSHAISAICLSGNGTLFVGGIFNRVGGATGWKCSNVVALEGTGAATATVRTSMNLGVSGSVVRALAYDATSGRLFVGGILTGIGSVDQDLWQDVRHRG